MPDQLFDGCLYFAVSKLNRAITKMAEEEFQTTGLSPTYAFLLMLVNEKPGISPSELSGKLFVAPSTVTRFLDKLENKGLVVRKSEGKSTAVQPTAKSLELEADIRRVWQNLLLRYSALLGESEGRRLTHILNEAAAKI